jgi:hypothetical protein
MDKRIKAAEDNLAPLPKPSEKKQEAIEAGKQPTLDAAVNGLKDYKPPVQGRTFAATAAIFVSLLSNLRNLNAYM